MKSPEDFQALLERIVSRPPDEQREMLLDYFSEVLAGMSVPMVQALRTHFLRTFPPCPVQVLMIDVLDGHLAVAEINSNAP